MVMIVGGVHGNEPAGYKAAGKVKNYSIKKGKLHKLLPQANKRAVANGRRSMGGADLEPGFPRSKYDSADNTLSRAIFPLVKDYKVDWLVDMHEGANYNRLRSTSRWTISNLLSKHSDTEVCKSLIRLTQILITSYIKKFPNTCFIKVSGSRPVRDVSCLRLKIHLS